MGGLLLQMCENVWGYSGQIRFHSMIPDFLYQKPGVYVNQRFRTPVFLVSVVAAACFSASAYAQNRSDAINQPPSKVAVGQAPAGVIRLVPPAQAQEELAELEERKQTGSKYENGRVFPRRQDSRVFSRRVLPGSTQDTVQSAELIPGLEAAKTPPAPAGSDPESPPVYVSGEHLEGHAEAEVKMQGRAQLIRGMTVVQGEELTYDRRTEVATATDNVRINHEGNVFVGTRAQLHVPTNQGYFDDATYRIYTTGAGGRSSRIDFNGENRMLVHDATYSLCEPRADGRYDWVLTADSVDLDFDKDEGVARNAVLRFMGTPILATPWMSFPLSDKRRSGWLVPTFNMDSDSGFGYEQPYYWNIAPNYDATISPFFMTKRGLGMNLEFRYLQPNYHGVFTGVFLPNDRLRDKENRWGYTLEHRQLLARNLDVLGSAQFSLELNRASDHNYWQDFPHASDTLTTRLLNNEGIIRTYNEGFSTLVRVQRWQTLQDPDAYITPPFDRTQFRFNALQEDQFGFDFSTMGDITKFDADDQFGNNVDGTRGTLRVVASYPFRRPGWFFVPKVQLLSRYYSFEQDITLPTGNTSRHRSITLPTFSIDSGLIFERRANLFGTDYVQTLEPRIVYTYTPYRDQSMLPLYDTGQYDYNMATVYLDNPYSGFDRIADVNMVTVGVGTRWQNPETGAEALSLNLAQRMRFADQRVTLDNRPITSRYSDVLLGIGTELVQNWRFDGLIQYDTDINRSQRSLLMARWKPGRYRVMNFGYRMTRDYSEQLDYSWQWPLGSPWLGSELPAPNKNGGRWYTVGRINYSLRDSKLIDGIIGFEYQSCCWVARVVAERLSTGRTEANTRLLFQLEFSGLSRVGVNPLQTLKDNISHYEMLRNERVIRPNDFYLYE